jgi:hypothetical protein
MILVPLSCERGNRYIVIIFEEENSDARGGSNRISLANSRSYICGSGKLYAQRRIFALWTPDGHDRVFIIFSLIYYYCEEKAKGQVVTWITRWQE